jgi:hypothetical protein
MIHLKTIGYVLISLLLSSCQTYMLKTTSKKNLVASQLKPFGNCWKAEGSVNFSVYKNNVLSFSAMLDWLQEPKEEWNWEIYDPLGRTVHSGKFVEKKLVSDSRLKLLETLEIQKDGFLYADGNNLYLKWKEFHCLLNIRLPEDWLEEKIWSGSQESASVVRFEDKDRLINLVYKNETVCGSIYVKYWLWNHKRFEWCFLKNPLRGILDFENTFKLEWTNTEDKENEWTHYSK